MPVPALSKGADSLVHTKVQLSMNNKAVFAMSCFSEIGGLVMLYRILFKSTALFVYLYSAHLLKAHK